jgi:hypothetical protein
MYFQWEEEERRRMPKRTESQICLGMGSNNFQTIFRREVAPL